MGPWGACPLPRRRTRPRLSKLEQLGKNRGALRRLRNSLNPFSRFDFGLLAGLRHARDWQAKGRR
jgi:hypothetical protein